MSDYAAALERVLASREWPPDLTAYVRGVIFGLRAATRQKGGA